MGVRRPSAPAWRIAAGLVAAVLIAAALAGFARDRDGVTVTSATIGGTPATIVRGAAGPAPVVVIAHGFAGSQQLMQAFALTLARAGLIALTFDFLGHGRHPEPLVGDVRRIGGATRNLVAQTTEVLAAARALGDGRVALLGHSMASDVIIRAAQAQGDVAATVAVSAFSRAVTAESPRNLLLIAGQWEGRLAAEAMRVLELSAAGGGAAPGVTYGDLAAGTARRFVAAPNVEHVGVLYSATSLSEAAAWLTASFGLAPGGAPAGTGVWILLLLAGLILLVWPLAGLLPVVCAPARGGGLPWRSFWPVLLAPTIVTPLLLRVTPTHVLPILVADYLAAHFAVFGLVLALARRVAAQPPPCAAAPRIGRLALAAACAVLATSFLLFIALDEFVTSVRPIPARVPLIAALFVGTMLCFSATEWASRGPAAARGAAPALLAAFLASLAIAVALDPRRLFFLAAIVPVIVPFMAVYGLFAAWVFRRTGHPFPGAAAMAAAFALAIGSTFPMLAG